MKIYDISQEVFSCSVYKGDPIPQKEIISDMSKGDLYNLTAFSMCAHNGTHIDAPSHFIQNGKSVCEIPLEKTVGTAYVAEFNGELTAADAENIINTAKLAQPESAARILLKGNCIVSLEAATVFANNGVWLLGVESQSVGAEESPMAVHKILLEKEIVLLEGIRLAHIKAGVYFLSAQPLNLGGSDGAPTRGILIDFNE